MYACVWPRVRLFVYVFLCVLLLELKKIFKQITQ